MRKRLLVGIIASVFLAAPAFAAIEVKNPLTKVVKQTGEEIYCGKVTAIAADGSGFTLGEIEVFKGKIGESIEVVATEEIVKRVAKGSPVIVFYGLNTTLIHLDDHWFVGKSKEPARGKPKVNGDHATGAVDTFPGRTTALIEATRELVKTGKTSMIDSLKERLLNGDERVIQKLAGVKDPTSFIAGDVNGDGKADFFVCAGGSVRLFVSDGNSYVHATEKFGLQDVKGKKVELYSKFRNPGEDNPIEGILVDGVMYELSKGKFAKETASRDLNDSVKLPGGDSAMGNFGDANDAYTIAVKKDGIVRTNLWGKEAADSVRLTGGNILEYHTEQKEKGFANFQCTVIDANGDGRDDLFIRADGGNLLLINRGFGAFMVDRDSGSTLKHAGLLSSGRLSKDSKEESLLVLEADGTIYGIDTTQH